MLRHDKYHVQSLDAICSTLQQWSNDVKCSVVTCSTILIIILSHCVIKLQTELFKSEDLSDSQAEYFVSPYEELNKFINIVLTEIFEDLALRLSYGRGKDIHVVTSRGDFIHVATAFMMIHMLLFSI